MFIQSLFLNSKIKIHTKDKIIHGSIEVNGKKSVAELYAVNGRLIIKFSTSCLNKDLFIMPWQPKKVRFWDELENEFLLENSWVESNGGKVPEQIEYECKYFDLIQANQTNVTFTGVVVIFSNISDALLRQANNLYAKLANFSINVLEIERAEKAFEIRFHSRKSKNEIKEIVRKFRNLFKLIGNVVSVEVCFLLDDEKYIETHFHFIDNIINFEKSINSNLMLGEFIKNFDVVCKNYFLESKRDIFEFVGNTLMSLCEGRGFWTVEFGNLLTLLEGYADIVIDKNDENYIQLLKEHNMVKNKVVAAIENIEDITRDDMDRMVKYIKSMQVYSFPKKLEALFENFKEVDSYKEVKGKINDYRVKFAHCKITSEEEEKKIFRGDNIGALRFYNVLLCWVLSRFYQDLFNNCCSLEKIINNLKFMLKKEEEKKYVSI